MPQIYSRSLLRVQTYPKSLQTPKSPEGDLVCVPVQSPSGDLGVCRSAKNNFQIVSKHKPVSHKQKPPDVAGLIQQNQEVATLSMAIYRGPRPPCGLSLDPCRCCCPLLARCSGRLLFPCCGRLLFPCCGLLFACCCGRLFPPA